MVIEKFMLHYSEGAMYWLLYLERKELEHINIISIRTMLDAQNAIYQQVGNRPVYHQRQILHFQSRLLEPDRDPPSVE